MIYVILVLSIILILMLIFFLYKNNSNKSTPTPTPKPTPTPTPKPTPKPTTPGWTFEEKCSFFNFLKSKLGDAITDDSYDCIISNLSGNNISYKIINDKTDDEKKEILKKYANNCLLGVKGNWSDYLKKMVMEELMGNVTVGINGGCALCILGVLEQTFNPEEINEKNILQKIDPLKMQCLNACKK
jgi:hypothetical protein